MPATDPATLSPDAQRRRDRCIALAQRLLDVGEELLAELPSHARAAYPPTYRRDADLSVRVKAYEGIARTIRRTILIVEHLDRAPPLAPARPRPEPGPAKLHLVPAAPPPAPDADAPEPNPARERLDSLDPLPAGDPERALDHMAIEFERIRRQMHAIDDPGDHPEDDPEGDEDDDLDDDDDDLDDDDLDEDFDDDDDEEDDDDDLEALCVVRPPPGQSSA